MADNVYQSAAGSNIGTLLRLIQEDQNRNLAATPPATESSSPIRGVIQGPLQAPEAPQSSRVVSIKPEGALQQGPQQPSVSNVVPAGGGAIAGGVIAPRAPVAPVAAPSFDTGGGGGVSAPSMSSSVPSDSMKTSLPNIGTSIKSVPSSSSFGSVLGSSTKKTTVTPQSKPTAKPAKSAPILGGQKIVLNNLKDLINKSFKFLPSTGLGGREGLQKLLNGFA